MAVAGSGYHFNPYYAATAFSYGTGCAGLGISPVGLPTVGNFAFSFDITGIDPSAGVAIVGVGDVAVHAGIDLTPEGMPGCFNHTNLAYGLFFSGPIFGGVSNFALPIPADPTLRSARLAIQGASQTPSTPLGYGTSNANWFNIGN